MKQARRALVASLGLFALVAQTLLFREFLAAFEGHELVIGSFFGFWLLWVAAGALGGRLLLRSAPQRTRYFPWVVLLYAPAFLVQLELIARARFYSGVATYEAFPLATMFWLSFWVNAPVSAVTGALFTWACRWFGTGDRQGVAEVYIWETCGAFLGGVAVTILLALHFSTPWLFLSSFLVVSLASALCVTLASRPGLSASDNPGQESSCGDSRDNSGDSGRSSPASNSGRTWCAWCVPLMVALCLTTGLPGHWTAWHQQATWHRLLPNHEFRGSFATAQAEYLYGQHAGQFVVASQGSIVESLPPTDHDAEVLALSLAQNPNARRVLMIGPSSLGMAFTFQQIAQVEQIVWLHVDPDYPGQLSGHLPQHWQTALSSIETPPIHARQFLQDHPRQFDLAIVNLPDATTFAANQYATLEFFQLLRRAMRSKGVCCVRVSGGANYLGSELALVGASTLRTVESVFPNWTLKPGSETWLIATTDGDISGAGAVLRDRLRAVSGASSLFPPEGLLSLYVADRADFQRDRYESVARRVEASLLLNTDDHPKTLLFSLLVLLRQSGWSIPVPILTTWLGTVVLLALAVPLGYVMLRSVYLLAPGLARAERSAAARPFDSYVMVLTTGAVGMALSIILMLRYQSRYGTLFLDIGLISSLFMLGAAAGGALARWHLQRTGLRRFDLFAWIFAHSLAIGLLILLPYSMERWAYSLLLAANGVFIGAYFPVAAEQLRSRGHSSEATGAALEWADHLGGSIGAVITGWLLLPSCGDHNTLAILLAVVWVNGILLWVPRRRPIVAPDARASHHWARPAGYALLGTALMCLILSNGWAWMREQDTHQQFLNAVLEMVPPDTSWTLQSAQRDGEAISYVECSDGSWIFSTESLADEVRGYGGPIVLVTWIAPDGQLRDVRVLAHRETPAYLEAVRRQWLDSLAGHDLFSASPFEGVDAVSGATVTSEAILATLTRAGREFARLAGVDAMELGKQPSYRFALDKALVALVFLTIFAFAIHYRPGRWRRRAFLLTTMLVCGLWLNVQYSAHHAITLLSAEIPRDLHRPAWFLIVAVPLLVFMRGNLYCGYLCPFGAMQELIADLRPRGWKLDPEVALRRAARMIRYGILALLIILFAMTRDHALLDIDPLTTVFSLAGRREVWTFGIAMAGLSFFFRRFWCTTLCPAGAFLSVVCSLGHSRRWFRPALPRRCDLAVNSSSDMNCISCDRCRHEQN